MFLVIKRFELYDIPAKLCKTARDAHEYAEQLESECLRDDNVRFATEAEQKMLSEDITTEMAAIGIWEFDHSGKPIAYETAVVF